MHIIITNIIWSAFEFERHFDLSSKTCKANYVPTSLSYTLYLVLIS